MGGGELGQAVGQASGVCSPPREAQAARGRLCSWCQHGALARLLACGHHVQEQRSSATGTRTRVARVRAEYPSQLDYSGSCKLKRLANAHGRG